MSFESWRFLLSSNVIILKKRILSARQHPVYFIRRLSQGNCIPCFPETRRSRSSCCLVATRAKPASSCCPAPFEPVCSLPSIQTVPRDSCLQSEQPPVHFKQKQPFHCLNFVAQSPSYGCWCAAGIETCTKGGWMVRRHLKEANLTPKRPPTCPKFTQLERCDSGLFTDECLYGQVYRRPGKWFCWNSGVWQHSCMM